MADIERELILKKGLVRVDNNLTIEKCDGYDNFEHGADWTLCLDNVQEAKDLIELLTAMIDELGDDEDE